MPVFLATSGFSLFVSRLWGSVQFWDFLSTIDLRVMSKGILLERRNLVLYDLSHTFNQVLYLDRFFQRIDSPDLEVLDVTQIGTYNQ